MNLSDLRYLIAIADLEPDDTLRLSLLRASVFPGRSLLVLLRRAHTPAERKRMAQSTLLRRTNSWAKMPSNKLP